MLKKTASSTPQPPIEITGELPVLSAADFFSSVPEEPAIMQNTRPELLSRPRLLISSSLLDETYEVLLEKDAIAIGESDSNDIVLRRDYMAAPYHALLKKQDGDYYLFEGRSKNGIFVNGQKLVSGLGFKLADGDQIVIGQYRLIFSNTNLPSEERSLGGSQSKSAREGDTPKMVPVKASRHGVPTQEMTKPMAGSSIARKVTLTKMLTLPSKRNT